MILSFLAQSDAWGDYHDYHDSFGGGGGGPTGWVWNLPPEANIGLLVLLILFLVWIFYLPEKFGGPYQCPVNESLYPRRADQKPIAIVILLLVWCIWYIAWKADYFSAFKETLPSERIIPQG